MFPGLGWYLTTPSTDGEDEQETMRDQLQVGQWHTTEDFECKNTMGCGIDPCHLLSSAIGFQGLVDPNQMI